MPQEITLIQTDLDKAVQSGEYIHCDPKLQQRRKAMLSAHYSGLLTPATMTEFANQFGCSEWALYKDWSRRPKWEPFIWESVKNIDDAKNLVGLLQMARETAALIMRDPRKGGNVRVGAIGKFTEAIKTEVELLQGMGVLPKQTAPAVVVNQVTQVNAKAEAKIMIDLGKLSEDDRKALLRAEEALTRAETATSPQ